MKNNEQGGVLIIAIVFSCILSILTASILSVTVAQTRLVDMHVSSAKAFFAAEAGVERAVALFRNNIYGPHNLAGATSESIYTPTASSTTNTDVFGNPTEIIIQIQGSCRNATRTVEVVMEVINPFTHYGDFRDCDFNYTSDSTTDNNLLVGPRHFNGNLTFRHGDGTMDFIGDVEATGSIANTTGGVADYEYNGTEGGLNAIDNQGNLVTGLTSDHTSDSYYGYSMDWDGTHPSISNRTITIQGAVKPNAPYVAMPTTIDLDAIAAKADYAFIGDKYIRMVRDPASGGDPSIIDEGDKHKIYVFSQTGDKNFNPLNPSAGADQVIDLTADGATSIIYVSKDVHIKGEEYTDSTGYTYNRAILDGQLTIVAGDDMQIDGEIVYAGDTLPPPHSPVTDYDEIEGDDSIALLAKDRLYMNTNGSGWSDNGDGFPRDRESIMVGVHYSYNAQISTGSILSDGGFRIIGSNLVKNSAGSTNHHFVGSEGRERSYDWRFRSDSSVIPPGLEPTIILKSWSERVLS